VRNAFAVIATCALIAFASLEANTKELRAPGTPISKITTGIPVDWLTHVRDDLLLFWDQESAYGQPIGNFPTYRCNDGSVLDVDNPCPAFSQLGKDDEWITSALDKDYVRMKSRQIFAYGVAFHMTGDPRYIILARAGVEYLQTHALDPSGGSIVSYWEGGIRHSGPPRPQRTSQDLAYGLQGLAFYCPNTLVKTMHFSARFLVYFHS